MMATVPAQKPDPRVALFRPAFEMAAAAATSWDRFAAMGLPRRDQESWHYADLSMLARGPWNLAAPAAPSAQVNNLLAGLTLNQAADRMVLVNGHQFGKVAAAEEARQPLSLACDNSLAALNDVLSPRPITVRVAAGATTWLNLVSLTVPVSNDEMSHPRVVIEVADNATLDLRLEIAGVEEMNYWANSVIEIIIGANAKVRATSLIREGNAAFHTGIIAASIGRNANFVLNEIILGGRSIRREAVLEFNGEGGEASLGGAYLGASDAKIDVTSDVRHAAPRCRSTQLYRGVVDDKAFAAFQGRIYVAPHAQGTDAAQTTRSLLLARTAEAAAKPELEIHADDVKCSHGATVGELDADMLFYLQGRGIPAPAARAMLVEAFIAEVVEAVEDMDLRQRILSQVSQWMTARRHAS